MTLPLTAQVAKLNITEAAKCSDFLCALPASYDNFRSEWRTVSRFAIIEDDKTFDILSHLFNTLGLQLQRQKVKEQPSVMLAGRQGKQKGKRECWSCGGKGHLSTRPKPKIGDGHSHRPAKDRVRAKPVAKDEPRWNMDDIILV